MKWKNIYRGIMMGSSDLIPGVSGGTIAVLLGIYDDFIAAINGIFSKEWRKHFAFLLPLGIGIVIAIVLLSRVMEWLLAFYPGPTYFFFLGLIIGVLPLLFREAEAKITFTFSHYVLVVIGMTVVGSLLFIQDIGQNETLSNLTLITYLLLFISGILASAAMILPGVSGSMVFLVLGVYPTVIRAVSNFQFEIIIIVALGIVIGIVTMSKIIHYFLKHFRTNTFALINGSVIGSLFVVFPGWPQNSSDWMIHIVTFAAGLGVAYILGKVEYEA